MANLTFTEKQLVESVFNLKEGYVINFSNREFEEFMKDVVEYNIYTKYPGLSKAKMLRAFLNDESDAYAGKAIAMLIEYMRGNNLISDAKKAQSDKLYTIASRLLGKNEPQPAAVPPKPKDNPAVDFTYLNTSLLEIENCSTQQAKGYAFERYLNQFFNAFGLEAHAAYRTEFDQIDGSFVMDSNTILIEAKYRTTLIPKNDLILFTQKVSSKSHYSRGLFITYSPLEATTIEYFMDRSARLVVITVEELFLVCQNKTSIQEVLKKKFRALDERGLIHKHYLTL